MIKKPSDSRKGITPAVTVLFGLFGDPMELVLIVSGLIFLLRNWLAEPIERGMSVLPISGTSTG